MIVHLGDPQDRLVALEYLSQRVGIEANALVWNEPWEMLACVRGRTIIGTVMYNSWRGRSIETHWAGEPGWLTRAHLRDIFAFPFIRLGCLRVGGIIRRKNRTARKAAERIGFKLEGVAEKGFEDGTDAMLYGMTHDKCRWIA